MNKSFPTLTEAYGYVNGLIGAGLNFQSSRVYADRITKPKANLFLMYIGVSKRCESICKRLSPGGTWGVEIEQPGTSYEVAGIFGPVDKKTQSFRASTWYSKYLPYAYAMMKAEWDFPYPGINYQSINSYYGTCMGFADILQDGRIDVDDIKLYDEIADCSPSHDLPFTAMYANACVFVAIQSPKLFRDHHDDKDSWAWKYTNNVLDKMGRPHINWK